MKQLIAFLLILTLGSLACSFNLNTPPLSFTPQPASTDTTLNIQATLPQAAVSTSPPALLAASPTPAAPVETENPPTLTNQQLKNATLSFSGSDQTTRTFSLRDGKYETDTDPSQPGYMSINLGEMIAFGDLNGDGLQDAAITIAENFGGTGVFVSLVAVLNQAGQPQAAASTLIDDRPVINALSIQNGEIHLDATIHGINDPLCCAALPNTRSYRLIENALVLSQYTTQVSDGRQRIIEIVSPPNDVEISSPFLIKGSVSISPFENNLVYTVMQAGSETPIEKAGFIINADGMGGPGEFELALDLGKYNLKGPIWIEIADTSPADGSFLAVSTLYLVLK